MIVSALVTSVAINLGLCILFFTLYSVLRKQPSNFDVYVPRLLADGKLKKTSHFHLERLLPTPGWVKRAWQLSEEELLSSSGLDAVVFMRLIIFSLRVFSVAGIIGVFVLLPVNCTGDQLQEIDFVNLTNNSLDVFSISNLNNGSKRLWIHFSAVYIVTIFVCYLLYYEYKYISAKRVAYFYSSKPQAHQFTILVRSIPVSIGSSVSESVDSFFKEYYPSTYLSHVVVHRTNKLRDLILDAQKLYKRLLPLANRTKSGQRLSVMGKKLELLLCPSTLGLANLSQLEIWFPFLKSILTITFVSEVITGYLPSLILQLFLKLVPPIMKFFSSIQGYISNSEIEKSACNKVLWNIPAKLAVVVPAQASFFIAYVVTSGWTSTSTELFRIIPLICCLITKPFTQRTDDEFEVPSLPYHRDIPRVLFFGLLGITYFFLAPLILPFLLVYFCLAYIIYRNQFINVYAPNNETGGKFWPIVHNSMIFSLVLMHAIAVGIFTLKKLPLAPTIIFPLPILTLLFNEYCRKRFLPIFIAFSAESLIKKDREDSNDATMAEFFDNLATAYQDPALLPIQYSANPDSRRTPLLSSIV
ncbi:hypothetical protein F0562_032955 [Nyssa sinensis]|uniref:CSC1/OSCA1-like 7TM region domain-containing protein n=1 Tax=Nyssa sinensis TaxID=561372 RepID=A0A5J5ARQ1_9ASTE|nr:hypothetical protein F0562_032955 [Nyssa sinensis]